MNQVPTEGLRNTFVVGFSAVTLASFAGFVNHVPTEGNSSFDTAGRDAAS